MRLATFAAFAALFAAPVLAQPFDFVAVDGPWLSDAVQYARADGLVLARTGTVVGRSWDGGATWETIDLAPDIRDVKAYQGGLLAGSSLGLVQSYDNGSTWETVAFDGELIRSVQAPDSLYAQASDGTVYRSGGDLGRWTALDIPSGERFAPIASGLGGDLASYSCDLDNTCSLSRSVDYGETFVTEATTVSPRNLVFEDGTLYAARGDILIQVGFDYITLPGGVYRFDDDQGEFSRIRGVSSVSSVRRQPDGRLTYLHDGALRLLVSGAGVPLPTTPQRAGDAVITDAATLLTLAAFYGPAPLPDGVGYVETSSGMVVSRDGGLAHTGFRNAPTGAVAQLGDGSLVVGAASAPGFGGTGDAYRSDGAWQPLDAGTPVRQFVPMWGEPDTLLVVPDYGENLGYVAYPITRLVGGETEAVEAEFCYSGEFGVAAIAFTADRVLTACAGYLGEHYLSVMDRAGAQLGEAFLEDRISSALITDADLWVGASAGAYDDVPDQPVRFSTDDGQTWQDRSTGLDGSPVLALSAFGDDVFAGTPGGVARWDGAAWVAEHEADDVATFALHDGVLYAGADGAVLRRDGTAWTNVGTGLDGAQVRGLAVGSDAGGLWLVAATDKGVRTTRPSLLVGSQDAPPTVELRTLRAFPNPVRGSLTIHTPTAGVQVDVFDAVGRRVARVSANQDGVARWDAAGVPAGVYLIRSGGDDVLTTRVVVVR